MLQAVFCNDTILSAIHDVIMPIIWRLTNKYNSVRLLKIIESRDRDKD